MSYGAWMDSCYFQHHTKDKDLKDPETDLLKLDYIVINTDHLRDFSTNLIGTFQPQDCYWKLRNDGMDGYFGEAWEEGELVKFPSSNDCELHEERGAFYLPIGKCAGSRVNASGTEPLL
ncbi:MAG: hypothetical protein IPM82_05580 [Saprospiraceae bacterium]|nr:hypothetical protein [Saprospiraceae bacterium]